MNLIEKNIPENLRNFDEKLPNFWTRCLRIVDRNMFTHENMRTPRATGHGDEGGVR